MCHRPTLSLTGLTVGSIEYSLCNIMQFRNLPNFPLAIHEYTHLPSPDTVPNRVCRWLDRIFSLHLYAVSLLPINNPQIYSLAITIIIIIIQFGNFRIRFHTYALLSSP